MPEGIKIDTEALSIRKFDKALHDRSAFYCGQTPIDNFLKSSLSDHTKARVLVAYIATLPDSAHIIGFYTLGAMAVREIPEISSKIRSAEMPVIYIKVIAVHKDYQGRKLGTALLVDALKKCAELSDQVGACAVVLDVLNDENFNKRLKFYQNCGFKDLRDAYNPSRLYISIADVKASIL